MIQCLSAACLCCSNRLVKRRNYTCTSLDRPLRLQDFESSRISRQSVGIGDHLYVPSALPPSAQEIPMVLISVRGWIEPRTRIKSMKNPNNPIGNRTRDLPAFSWTHEPTATPSCFSISELRVISGAHILTELLSKTILTAFCSVLKWNVVVYVVVRFQNALSMWKIAVFSLCIHNAWSPWWF
jgi:hypothetical protein